MWLRPVIRFCWQKISISTISRGAALHTNRPSPALLPLSVDDQPRGQCFLACLPSVWHCIQHCLLCTRLERNHLNVLYVHLSYATLLGEYRWLHVFRPQSIRTKARNDDEYLSLFYTDEANLFDRTGEVEKKSRFLLYLYKSKSTMLSFPHLWTSRLFHSLQRWSFHCCKNFTTGLYVSKNTKHWDVLLSYFRSLVIKFGNTMPHSSRISY